MPTYPGGPTFHGANVWACFYPGFDFNYYDTEPGQKNTQINDNPTGLLTHTKQLGTMLQMAFVGESVDIRWYGAIHAPDDWGDGSGVGSGSFTHTYDRPGLFWIKSNGSNGANSLRLMKVIYRTGTGPGIDAEGEFSNRPIYEHLYGYPILLDPMTEGSIDSAFAMKFSILMDGVYPTNDHIGYTVRNGGIALFAELFENNETDGRIKMIAGGFMTNRTLTLSYNRDRLTGIAFDIIESLSRQYMREQWYDDAAMIGYAMTQEAYGNFYDAVNEAENAGEDPPLPGSTNFIDWLTTDWAGLGYIPNHILPLCRPDYVAAHLLQHVRVSAAAPFTNPTMANNPDATPYGSLGQFMNIYVDSDFNELQQGKGFHGFAVTNGNVLPNIRQLLENNGAVIHSRTDMTLVLSRKPFYKTTLPAATLTLDLPDAVSPVIISEGTPQPIWKIQIEKPMLGVDMDDDGSNIGLQFIGSCCTNSECMNLPPGECPGWTCGPWTSGPFGDPADCEPAEPPTAFNSNAAFADYESGVEQDKGEINVEDALTMSVKPSDFLYEYVCGAPGGQIIGPLSNIFSTDLAAHAAGLCREKRAHWQIVAPLGNYHDIDLGDIVDVNYTRTSGLKLEWVAKKFWVIRIQLKVTNSEHTRQITLIEIQPDLDESNQFGGSTNNPSSPCAETLPSISASLVPDSLVCNGDGSWSQQVQWTCLDAFGAPTACPDGFGVDVYVGVDFETFATSSPVTITIEQPEHIAKYVYFRTKNACGTGPQCCEVMLANYPPFADPGCP